MTQILLYGVRDGRLATGRVLGKICLKKMSLPPLFSRRKSLRTPFIGKKNS